MFPLNSNQAYIKDTGERTTLGDVIGSGGGGSSELPEYSTSNAGQVLIVDDDGELTWGDGIPEHSAANAGQVLTVDDEGELAWGEVAGGGYANVVSTPQLTVPTTNVQEVTA